MKHNPKKHREHRRKRPSDTKRTLLMGRLGLVIRRGTAWKYRPTSKYRPHQGVQECERRLRRGF